MNVEKKNVFLFKSFLLHIIDDKSQNAKTAYVIATCIVHDSKQYAAFQENKKSLANNISSVRQLQIPVKKSL